MVGYHTRNKDILSLEFHCPICSLILRDPVQLRCGHRQCRSCVDSADRELIECPQCKQITSKEKVLLDRGFKNDMQILSIECPWCEWTGFLKDYESHSEAAHANPVCEYCGKNFDSTHSLHSHKLTECDNVIVPCTLKDYGCSDQIRRSEISNHYMTEQHQIAIAVVVRQLICKLSSNLYERRSGMEVDISSNPTTAMTSGNNDYSSTQLEEVYKTIDIIVGGMQALSDDTQLLSNESLRLRIHTKELDDDLTTLRLSVEEDTIFLNGLKPNQDILSQDVASFKQKVEDIRSVSYDGMFIWKITSFQEKMTDAQSERQTSIYSPPFYSSPTGYKMRARLYLNGDGNARRTHLSLFFVLMRSEHDAILKFPFNHKVTFCLLDQTPDHRHIIDSFRPDPKSNSFQRPQSEMNIASGIPKFFPLAMIQQQENPYVRDDTMFIKIIVDFGDLPKTLLPYALSLNPGLPLCVQHAMIKQEIERRTQQNPVASSLLPQSEVKQK